MHSCIRPIGSFVLACAALGSPAAANTIVVSASGGGTFTDIPPAIAAAQNGDVILVLPGTYSAFSLQTNLTIVGSGNVDVAGLVSISNITAGGRVALVNVRPGHLEIGGCAGHVIVQDVAAGTLATSLRGVTVTQCADVRLSNVFVRSDETNTNFLGALTVSQSRVEIVRGSLQGYAPPSPSSTGISGGDGLRATSGSRAHVVLTNITAGKGADTSSGAGGFGGNAVNLQDVSQAFLAGDGTQQLLGGDSGYGDLSHDWIYPCFNEGIPGLGAFIEAGAQLSWSGVVLNGGLSYEHGTCNLYHGAPIMGPAAQVVPDDPALEIVGTPAAGSTVTIRLLAPPGSQARLKLGRNAIVVADGLAPIENLGTTARSVQLGVVPASGVRTVAWQIPFGLGTGGFVVLQAEVTLPGGVLARTNSVPVIVR